jgi:hypothetical protein
MMDGTNDPMAACSRLSGIKYEIQRMRWNRIRVMKNVTAKRTLERKCGYKVVTARMKVGS